MILIRDWVVVGGHSGLSSFLGGLPCTVSFLPVSVAVANATGITRGGNGGVARPELARKLIAVCNAFAASVNSHFGLDRYDNS